jgi:hypothetical protein
MLGTSICAAMHRAYARRDCEHVERDRVAIRAARRQHCNQEPHAALRSARGTMSAPIELASIL